MGITKVHKTYCERCPSRQGQITGNHDPESLDIMAMPNGVKQTFVFPCAWRNEKLCKGICEDLDYNEEDHAHLIEDSFQIPIMTPAIRVRF